MDKNTLCGSSQDLNSYRAMSIAKAVKGCLLNPRRANMSTINRKTTLSMAPFQCSQSSTRNASKDHQKDDSLNTFHLHQLVLIAVFILVKQSVFQNQVG